MSLDNALPIGWAIASFEDVVCVIRNGMTATQNKIGDGVPVTRIETISDGSINLDRVGFISPAVDAPNLSNYLLSAGDVLFSHINSSSHLGKTAVVRSHHLPLLHGMNLLLLRPETRIIEPDLLHVFCNHSRFKGNFSAIAQHAVNQASINQRKLKSILVTVPPLNEQRRIVAKIDELSSDLDAGVAALKRAMANLKRYRAAVLKAAVEGRLTAEWRAKHPATEPATKLLQRILAERRQRWEADQEAKYATAGKTPPKGWREKYVEPKGPDTNGLPALPEKWCWTTAEQVSFQVTDGEHNQPRYQESGLPMLTATHVRNNSVIFDRAGLISEEDYKRARMRCRPEQGNVLVVCVGATTGRAGIVGAECAFALVRSVLLIKPALEGLYLLNWIQSPWCQKWISTASGSTAQAHFYISDAKRMPVPLGPVKEQAVIQSEVAEKLSEIDAADLAINRGLLRAGRLRQSILKQAFAGKLVAQDPNDEPASMLLERIRGSRPSPEGNGERAGAFNQRSRATERGRRVKK